MKQSRLSLRLAALCLACLLSLAACGQQEAPPANVIDPEAEQTAVITTDDAPSTSSILYECTVGDTYCYSAPTGDQADLLGYIPQGTQAELVTARDGYVQLRLPGGMEVWCSAWMLDPVDDTLKQQRDQEFFDSCISHEAFYSMVEQEPVYTCIRNGLDCRLEPEEDSPAVYRLAAGSSVPVYGRVGDFYLCRLPIGKLAWASVSSLCVTDKFSIADNAVDLREWLPEAEFEILFASPNNITGHALYEPIPMMELATATALKAAYEQFRADGYTIKVYDAYRPKSAQYQLYDIVQDNRFIANPYTGNSWHQFGRAIDMSLIDLSTGEELVMPTPMHTFSTDASRWNKDQWSEGVQANVDYMTDVMLANGFSLLSTEWWHFQLDSSIGSYLDNNMDLANLPTKPAY